MPMLRVRLLGTPEVTVDGEPVAGLQSSKALALLAYLIVEHRRPQSRDALAALFWADQATSAARRNLRRVLYSLRNALGDRGADGDGILVVTRDTIQFRDDGDVWADVSAFQALAGRATGGLPDPTQLAEAVDLYRGAFLEGFSVTDSVEFEDWATVVRERLHRQASQAFQGLIGCLLDMGRCAEACPYAWRRVELEPWQEDAHIQLMQCLALSGQRTAALAQYDVCCEALARDFGVEPSPALRELRARIRDGTLGAGVHPGGRLAPVMAPPLAQAAGPAPALPPFEPPLFVARERELTILEDHLNQALDGHGHAVFVTGEAGEGKTALIQALAHRALGEHPALIPACGSCNAYTGIGDPYGPFCELLCMLAGDIEARAEAVAVGGDVADRLTRAFPVVAQALVREGRDLIDAFVPGAQLLRRAGDLAWGGDAGTGRGHRARQADAARWIEALRAEIGRRREAPPDEVGQTGLFHQATAVLKAVAVHAPLLLVLDDLHWADAGSVRLLFHLGRHLAGSRILVVGAYRSEEVARGRGDERHPLELVVNEFTRTWGDIRIDLGHADTEAFVAALIDSEPNALDAGFRSALLAQTRGHALFTIELLQALRDRGDLRHDAAGRWVAGSPLTWDRLPERVEAVIDERIRRLDPSVVELLGVASVEGEAFTAEVVADVLGVDARATVRTLSRDLDRRQHLVHAQGTRRLADGRALSRYRFRHILFQRYLYGTLDPVERTYLHGEVGEALRRLHAGEPEGSAGILPQLARHADEAGLLPDAVNYYERAAGRATRLSAFHEARSHLNRALTLLRQLPAAEARDQVELRLQSALTVAVFRVHTLGDEREAQAYQRALALARALDDVPRQVIALHMMEGYHQMRSEHRRARTVAEQLYALAERSGDPACEIVGHFGIVVVTMMQGDFVTCLDHAEAVLASFDPVAHRDLALTLGQDPAVVTKAACVYPLWYLGYPDRALATVTQGLAIAAERDDPYLRQVVLSFAARLHRWRREAEAVAQLADQELALGQAHDVASARLSGRLDSAWVLAQRGRPAAAASQYAAALEGWVSMGSSNRLPEFWCVLAEMLADASELDQALARVADALALIEETDERYHEAEVYRLRGALRLRQDATNADDAEADFRRAVELARSREHRMLELRAVTSLARLALAEDRDVAPARDALAERYTWFTEGHDTADLVEARDTLAQLESRLA